MTSTIFRTPAAEVAHLTGILPNWCRQPNSVLPAELNGLLERIADCLEAVPPTVIDLATLAQLRNRLRAVRVYLQAKEHGAAAHEATQLHRKVGRLPA